MTKEQFESLVKKLEEYSERDPGGYRRRVGLLAALGYGYVWFVLAIVLALLAALVWAVINVSFNGIVLKVGLALLVLSYMIIRSLWISFPRPQGIRLSREQAPKLFEMIDELTIALQSPRFHQVLLDDEFNAAVVQHPKLGLLGWQENYLVLGLPLMQALSPEQFRAVVAHELGHLSGNHARFGSWIYRIAATWEQLQANFAQSGHHGAVLFEKFINWYQPFFSAYSFVLRRADEYVADRCAAELAGATAIGEALVSLQVKGQYLTAKFWPAVFKRAEHEAEPPTQTFSQLGRAFREEIAPDDARVWMERSLRAETEYSDTHPSLARRLQALGYTPGSESPGTPDVQASAAAFYLEAALEPLTQQLDAVWHDGIALAWKERHEYSLQSQSALQELDNRVCAAAAGGRGATDVLSIEELWNRARWTGEFRSNAEGVERFRELLAAYPEHAPSRFALGQILLEEDDESGIAEIEKAMATEPTATLDGCFLIYSYLKERGRDTEAKPYYDRATGHYEELELAEAERTRITARDTFLPPDIEAKDMEIIRAALRLQHNVGAAWLVRKQVQHMPELPCYVLGIETRQTVAKFFSSEDNQKLVDVLVEQIQDTPVSLVFVEDDISKNVLKAMRKVDGAKIYSYKDAVQR